MPKSSTYVQVKEPLGIRKILLTSALGSIKLLEMKEELLRLKKEKAKKILNLKETVSDLNILIQELNSNLPESKAKTVKYKEESKIKEIEIKEPKLGDIGKEIEEIKAKLESLNI